MAINGFSTCSKSAIGTFRIPGTGRSIAVRREVAPLLIGFAAEFHQRVERIDAGIMDDWGYHCRGTTGARSVPSFHAAGLAIDLNATRHPYGRRGTFSAAQRSVINALCRKYGLRAGMNYSRTPDDMHFEVILPRSSALALARRVQAPVVQSTAGARIPVTTAKTSGKLTVDGKFGPQTIKALQRLCGTTADGKWGTGSRRALQRKVGVRVDGQIGHGTIRAFQRWIGAKQDGYWGPGTTRQFQNAYNAGRLK